ncbi:MAG TPA: PilZ domain-containing protein [Rhizomicrobium sp.]|nr:PilZ domain-containing protein [Rhizomicrobium sp.]
MAEEFDRPYRGPERRRDKRRTMTLTGRVFCADKGEAVRCTLIDISPGGAAVSCRHRLSPGDAVVLYVDELGKFEGAVVGQAGQRISIRFDQSERARKRAMEKIALFKHGRLKDMPAMKAAYHAYDPVMSRFTWSDGRTADCEILDISLTEASLRTDTRPRLNDIIHIGLSSARVVQHDAEGIRIEFLGGAR